MRLFLQRQTFPLKASNMSEEVKSNPILNFQLKHPRKPSFTAPFSKLKTSPNKSYIQVWGIFYSKKATLFQIFFIINCTAERGRLDFIALFWSELSNLGERTCNIDVKIKCLQIYFPSLGQIPLHWKLRNGVFIFKFGPGYHLDLTHTYSCRSWF